jgi:hypothetical protein
MKRSIALAAMIGATLVACSSKESHPGTAAQCSPGIDCVGVGSPPSGGGPVGGTDASTTDATVDAGLGTLTITNGHVVTAQSLTLNPASATLDSTESGLTVTALQGGVFASSTVTGGNFSFTNIDVTPPLTTFELDGRNTVTGGIGPRTMFYALIDASTKTIDTLSLPSFDQGFVDGIYGTFSITRPSATNYGTVVVQLVDTSNGGVSGVTATNPMPLDAGIATNGCPNSGAAVPANCGPYYDSGDGILPGAHTGSNGTIAFLSIPPGTFTFPITYPDGAVVSLSLPVRIDAVSFFRGTLH